MKTIRENGYVYYARANNVYKATEKEYEELVRFENRQRVLKNKRFFITNEATGDTIGFPFDNEKKAMELIRDNVGIINIVKEVERFIKERSELYV